MENLDLLTYIYDMIDWVMFILIILAGMFQKKYLSGFRLIKDKHMDGSWKTFLVGGFFVSSYIFLSHIGTEIPGDIWVVAFFTFVFTTSCYEMALKAVVNIVPGFKKHFDPPKEDQP